MKLRFYFVSERYSFTEFAKSFILNGSNEVIQYEEVKLAYEMLKIYLHFIKFELNVTLGLAQKDEEKIEIETDNTSTMGCISHGGSVH